MGKKDKQLLVLEKMSIKELFPLNPQQELFCLAYTTRGDMFCNNTKAYAEAYGYELPRRLDGSVDTVSSEYLACKANGGRMLFNPSVRTLIQNMFLAKFNEKVADAKVAEIIENGKDGDALQAIKIFNDLKQRVTKKLDVTVAARPLAGLSDAELEALAAE